VKSTVVNQRTNTVVNTDARKPEVPGDSINAEKWFAGEQVEVTDVDLAVGGERHATEPIDPGDKVPRWGDSERASVPGIGVN